MSVDIASDLMERFQDLVAKKDMLPIMTAIAQIVQASFLDDLRGKLIRPVTTDAEVRRRFKICMSHFRVLKGDMHWSVERTLDHLSYSLRCELDGVTWEPSKHATWSPDSLSEFGAKVG